MFLGPFLSPGFRQILPVHYKVHFFFFQKSFFLEVGSVHFFLADVVKPVDFDLRGLPDRVGV